MLAHLARFTIVLAIFLIPASLSAKTNNKRLHCQQNLLDKRILISNGKTLPAKAGLKISKYTPTSSDSVWSYGPCTVTIIEPGT